MKYSIIILKMIECKTFEFPIHYLGTAAISWAKIFVAVTPILGLSKDYAGRRILKHSM